MEIFFPNTPFAWVYLVVLAGIMAVASWCDFRTVIVPKKVSLALLASGFVITMIRCTWLGANGQQAWLFHPSNFGLGFADGLLFSLAGFITGFGLFFLMWMVNIAGGGDVKLAAGLGVWLGPKLLVGVLVFTVPIVFLVVIATYVGALLGYDLNPASLAPDPSTPKHVKRPMRRKMTFSLPLTIATILLILIVFRNELGLADTPTIPATNTEAETK